MRILNWFPGIAALVLCSLFATAQADEPAKHQLLSIEECSRRYKQYVFCESKNGLQCFWGQRKDLDPKYQLRDQLHIFDKNSLQVWPLTSEQIERQLAGSGGVGYAAFDSSGTKLAVLAHLFVEPDHVASSRILLIDLKTLDCEVLVADGWLNYNPTFSPDGRFIAYYATDRRTNPRLDPRKPLSENAGRIVNVQTKEVATITDYIVVGPTSYFSDEGFYRFPPPIWLDNDRLLFPSIATDQALISKYVVGFSGGRCAYVAVANVRIGEVKRLFLPPPRPLPWAEIDAVVDQNAKRLFLSNGKGLIRTDFDLGNPTVITKAGGKEMIVNVRVENGQVKYSIEPLPPE